MANDALEKRKKNKIATKPAQLAGLGVIPPTQDSQGNKLQIQPAVIQRPNALQSRAMSQGNLGMQFPTSGLADRSIHSNQAQANVTGSGLSSSAYFGNEELKKKKPGLLI